MKYKLSKLDDYLMGEDCVIAQFKIDNSETAYLEPVNCTIHSLDYRGLYFNENNIKVKMSSGVVESISVDSILEIPIIDNSPYLRYLREIR